MNGRKHEKFQSQYPQSYAKFELRIFGIQGRVLSPNASFVRQWITEDHSIAAKAEKRNNYSLPHITELLTEVRTNVN